MKKIIIIILIIVTAVTVGTIGTVVLIKYFNRNTTSNDVNSPNKSDQTDNEKPTEPYGYDYLDNWQKELYNLFVSDTLNVGDEYYLETERKTADVQLVIDLYYQHYPTRPPKTYGAMEIHVVNQLVGTGNTNKIKVAQWLNSDMNKELEKLKEVDKKTDEILSLIPLDATDYDKIKIIYDYFSANIQYDYDAFRQMELQTLDYDLDVLNAYGALLKGKAVCDGFARAFHYVAKKAGVYVLYIFSITGEHAWNVVWLDGKFYDIDTSSKKFLIPHFYDIDFVKGVSIPISSTEPFQKD